MQVQPGPDGKPKFWRFAARDGTASITSTASSASISRRGRRDRAGRDARCASAGGNCRPLPESGTARRAARRSAGRAPARGRARRASWRVVVVVIDPGAQHVGEQQRQPLRAHHALGAGRADAGGGQHPLLRAHRHGVERQRQRRVARAPSAAASAPPPCAAPAARAGASARRTAARAAIPRPCRDRRSASTLRSSLLDVGGEDRQRRCRIRRAARRA